MVFLRNLGSTATVAQRYSVESILVVKFDDNILKGSFFPNLRAKSRLETQMLLSFDLI